MLIGAASKVYNLDMGLIGGLQQNVLGLHVTVDDL
jgi:hypothetical protein